LKCRSTAGKRRLRANIATLFCAEEIPMKNPLDSLPGTIVCGLVLTVVLYFLVRNLMLG
jgi:hypothetical protein